MIRYSFHFDYPGERAAAMVEMIIALPIFLFFIFSCLEIYKISTSSADIAKSLRVATTLAAKIDPALGVSCEDALENALRSELEHRGLGNTLRNMKGSALEDALFGSYSIVVSYGIPCYSCSAAEAITGNPEYGTIPVERAWIVQFDHPIPCPDSWERSFE